MMCLKSIKETFHTKTFDQSSNPNINISTNSEVYSIKSQIDCRKGISPNIYCKKRLEENDCDALGDSRTVSGCCDKENKGSRTMVHQSVGMFFTV